MYRRRLLLGGMEIKMFLGSVKIPYSSIREMAILNKLKIVRLFSSRGLFGYFELFRFDDEWAWV